MEPRWLTEEEHRVWRAYRDLSLLLEDTLDQQLRHDAGLSHLNYSVLVFLSEAPGRRLHDRPRRTAEGRPQPADLHHQPHGRRGLGAPRGQTRRQARPARRPHRRGHGRARARRPGHVAIVRAAVFDRLSPEQVRAFGEVCETVLAGLTGPDRPVISADLPWRR